MSALFTLKPRQIDLLSSLKQAVASGARRPVLQAATGTGKTVLAAHVVDGALRKGKRVAFVVPRLTLIGQTFERFVANGIDANQMGVIQGNHEWRRPRAPVQICSVQTLDRRGFPQADVVVVDECFVAGTLVATTCGRKAIENVKPGEMVFNALGVGEVLGVSERKASAVIRISLSNGESLVVTPNHRFFTDAGWEPAARLERGSRIVSHEVVRALQDGDEADLRSSGICLEQEKVLLGVLLQEGDQPDPGFSGDQGSRQQVASRDWPQAEDQGREWQANDGSTGRLAGEARGRLDSGVRREHGEEERGVSSLLQDRHSRRVENDRDRSGWKLAPAEGSSGAGREEGLFSSIVRVESVSREERGSPVSVFNMHISGHPSYFAGGVLVHNCHEIFKAQRDWIAKSPNTVFIGLTATPWSKGMGDLYDRLVNPVSMQTLIDEGYLSKFRVFASAHPDLTGVRTIAGDYREDDLSSVMSSKTIVADVVSNWLDKGEGRQTILFAVDRAHAATLCEEFVEAGVAAEYIDGNTPREEREAMFVRYRNGDTLILCSVGVLTTGFDAPCQCIIFARPTRSEILWVQCFGRGLRVENGKNDLILFDHTDTALRLGLPTEINRDRLRTKATDDEEKQRVKDEGGEILPKPRECKACSFLIPPGHFGPCPSCGAEAPKRSSDVVTIEGELFEFGKDRPAKKPEGVKGGLALQGKQAIYSQLLALQGSKSDGWVGRSYQDIFGVYPRGLEKVHMEPSAPLRSWVKSKLIAYAASMKNRRAA